MKHIVRLALAIGITFFLFQAFDNQKKNVADATRSIKEDKHFTVVIPSYNNADYYKKNLDSILNQNYHNFEVVYIDDASIDGTADLVKSYLNNHDRGHKVTLVKNSANKKALFNLYTTIHTLDNDNIVVIVDGDDWLSNPNVLSYLNSVYQNPNVWLTYGEYEEYPSKAAGISSAVRKSVLKKAQARSIPWKFSHLRTFYAGLFKQIHLEDLMHKGTFFDVGYDMAIMFPMIEMATTHTFYTPEISYIYNRESPLNDDKVHKEHQLKIAKFVRSKQSYKKLTKAPNLADKTVKNADLVVFSYNRPLQLYSLLESIDAHVDGINEISVVYRSDDAYDSGYEIVKDKFTNATYYAQAKSGKEAKKDFKPYVMKALKEGKADYVLFAVDDIIITDKINVNEDIQNLEQTRAEGMYYRLGKNIDSSYSLNRFSGVPTLSTIAQDCFAWEFGASCDEWNYPHTVDFTLFPKEQVIKQFEKIAFHHPNSLEGKWAEVNTSSRVGLCKTTSRMVNIPMNIVSDYDNRFADSFTPEALNATFLEGKKIDIDHISSVEHNTPHFDIIPEFVER